MTSVGDENQYAFRLKVVLDAMNILGEPLEDALLQVPDAFRDAIGKEIEERIARESKEQHFFRAGSTIQDGGPRPWFDMWNTADGYHWSRLRQYLLVEKDWPVKDVDSLDDSSDMVLR